eukprot:CAMPEP_0206149948 /NCGR_PEP_ID=MMETSP1473-20131121/38047_1 /ASSEMBLY_ACC=CAM_ASM_001109 /TAXON_ID=1461547 /ORGANISM="Stichococcus sp, Strain RCC1054" /LENGTH=59 /DNA_ID=CAMNT_0053547433 /DNA_START=1413 /DNA_END=1592 /DNA_ORIENTATION=+
MYSTSNATKAGASQEGASPAACDASSSVADNSYPAAGGSADDAADLECAAELLEDAAGP